MELPENGRPRALNIGLTYNLKRHTSSDIPDAEAEYDDLDTILAVKKALEELGCRVELLEATDELPQKLMAQKPDIVFNIAEGTEGRGREAQVPALLNLFGIPFTGSDETTLCIALNKALTKRILASYHIRTPKYRVVRPGDPRTSGRLSFPVIVKPNAEGSSKGISDLSFVTDGGSLRRVLSKSIGVYRQDMLVEEYIEGREFTVGILGNGPDIRVFPPMEIIYTDEQSPYHIYSFDVKRNFEKYIRYECPPNLSPETRAELETTAAKIYGLLECRDFARIDFRLSPTGRLYFIEINPLPGLAPGYSDYPMLAEFSGMSYNALIQNILFCALKRHQLNFDF